MTNQETILVLGAGELGMAMVRGLARRARAAGRVSISVLLRPSTLASDDPARRRDIAELRALGAEPVAGDLAAQSADELAALFGRFDTVISCTGFAGGPGVQVKLAQAALAAGVKRYFPWQFGVDYDLIGRGSAQDLFDEQLDVRDLLRAQRRTEWVIVSTGMFTSFLFEPSFGVVDLAARRINALGGRDNAVTLTTADDIGALTAEIVFTEPRIANQVVYVAGDTVSYRELADTLERVLGGTFECREWRVAELEQQLAEAPDDALRKYRVVFAQGRGVAWDKTRTFNARHGIEVCTMAQWVRDHLPARA
ncbi:aromatic alcohol reductase [Burkholderia plantarii]|uniref:aromatic alcohol reductase n=1 Tax=Burkholderia plantarii TaxID=41899 RepID=UPI0018DDA8DF|nr:aromatic alcohol reductase [Burkholderia plantarii]MBI0326825.1 aromatic alcohol reductase [Burkholderia plantarii]